MKDQKRIHIITANVDGKRGRFFGELSDEEFQKLSDKIGGALPKGFYATHITREEIQRGSKRVDLLKTYPLIISDFWKTYADPEETILRAYREEKAERT